MPVLMAVEMVTTKVVMAHATGYKIALEKAGKVRPVWFYLCFVWPVAAFWIMYQVRQIQLVFLPSILAKQCSSFHE